jgi:hypothetical protein
VPVADPGVQAGLTLGQDVLDTYELVKTNNDSQWTSGGVGVYHTGATEDGSCDPNTSCDWAFNGDGGFHYGLWALTKGLGDYIASNLSDPNNWYAKVADLLVNSQLGNGCGLWMAATISTLSLPPALPCSRGPHSRHPATTDS